MTTIRVFHDPGRGAIFVSMVNAAFPSRSLVVKRQPGSVAEMICLQIYNSDQMLVAAPWSEYARRDGSGFASADEAFSYVRGECEQASDRMPTVSGAADADIVAGAPITISRQNGAVLPARADTYTLAFVAGLAAESASLGFPCRSVRTYVTLPDWTAVAGTPTLAPSLPYFLAPTGGITLAPLQAGVSCCVRVGEASTPTTLMFHPADPILL